MKQIVVPGWFVALDLDQQQGVWKVFQEALEVMPMTHTELARELGVAQSTVTRWVRGEVGPAPDKMKQALEVLARRSDEIEKRLDRAQRALRCVDEAVALLGQHRETGEKKHWRKQKQVMNELDVLIEETT